jgi:muconolactone delta-isomerase
MSWADGKQPILTIRSLQQSGRWDRAWRLIAGEFQNTPLVVGNRGGLKILRQPDYAVAQAG